jgi:sialic acid synthase SpsE
MNKYNPSQVFSLGEKQISYNDPVYFIAEIGSNFDQDLGRAKELIYMAKECGANAVKFQHYTAESLVSDQGFKKLRVNNSHQSSWKKSVFETYQDASLNRDWTYDLHQICIASDIDFFTSPYSLELVDLVDKYVPAHKIGSGDITWIKIVQHIAKKGKPVLLATGASSIDDVKRAVNAVLEITPNIVLLQCNTNYTANDENYKHLNLNVIKTYQELFPGIVTGLSDHMPGHISVLGAVSLGARVIEKHFTDSIERKGPDHSFSMTPSSFKEMVSATRNLEASFGNGIKKVEENEGETVVLQRRSICIINNKSKGDVLSEDDLSFLRPCEEDSIPPYEKNKVIGKSLTQDVSKGEPLKWSYLA